MKKSLLSLLAVLAGLCFGEVNDTLVSFKTNGPDTYKDGSVVLDGECYALVWVENGSTFGGFNADGSLVSANDKVIVVASLAEGGRCPPTLFEIAAKDAEKYAGGSFGLYLLDTRIKDAGGNVAVGGKGVVSTESRGITVNAAGLASTGNEMLTGDAVKLAEVGVYSKIGEPKITALRIDGAQIAIEVEGMSSAAEYFVMHGTNPGKIERKLATTVENETLKVEKPADDSTFLKVIGVRKFE